MATTYEEFVGNSNFAPPQIQPDFSFYDKARASTRLGAQETFLLTGAHALLSKQEERKAKARGEQPLTPEQTAAEFGPEFAHRDGEYLAQAKYRYNYERTKSVDEIVASEFAIAPQFAFGMAGSLVDAPFMALPGAAAVGATKKAMGIVSQGSRFGRVSKMVKTLDNYQKKSTLKKALSGAAIEQLAETQAVYQLSQYTGRDYGAMDMVMDAAFGGAITTSINVPLFAHAKRVARQQGRMVSEMAAIDSYFTSGDYSQGVQNLRKYSEDLELLIGDSPRVQELLDREPATLSAEEQLEIRSFLDEYIREIEVAEAKAQATAEMDPDSPILQERATAAEKIEAALKMTEEVAREKATKGSVRLKKIRQAVKDRKSRYKRKVGAVGDQPEPGPSFGSPIPGPRSAEEVNAKAKELEKANEQGSRSAASKRNQQETSETEAVFKKAKETQEVTAERVLSTVLGPKAIAMVKDTGMKSDEINKILDQAPLPPEKKALVRRLRKITQGTATFKVFLEDLPLDEIDVKGSSVGFFKSIQYAKNQVDQGKLTQEQARTNLLKELDHQEKALIAREVNDFRAEQQHKHLLGKDTDHVLKYFKTFLDGRARRGVATKTSSVETKILAQVAQDQAALRQVLSNFGLYDIFTGVATVGAETLKKHRLQTVNSAEAQAVYGAKLKEAHDLFWNDLLDAARSGEVPDTWKGVEAFEKVYEAYMQTTESQRVQLNEMGAGIRYREGWNGLSQRWDEQSILRHGEAEWRKDMRDNVDWEATAEAHGNILVTKVDEENNVQEWEAFDPEKFLDAWYHEITVDSNRDHPSQDIVAAFGKHRTVVIKPEMDQAMSQKYSGHKSLGLLYMDQVRHRSEMIQVARSLGTKPLPNVESLLKRYGVTDKAVTTLSEKGDEAIRDLNRKLITDTAKFLTGALDNPASKPLSRFGKAVRQISNIAFLPLSGVSAITDIPMIALTLQQSGMLQMHDMKEFATRYIAAHKRNFGSDKEMRDYLTAEGAGLDSALNAAAARIAIGDPNDPNLLQKINDVFFTANYLNGITQAGQEVFMDFFTKGLAEQIQAKEFSPQTVELLEAYGFSTKDVEKLIESVEIGPDGVPRVGPSSIKYPKVARKTQEMFMQLMNEAVLFPDAGTQAMVRGGLQSGTYAGEAARIGLQYTTFPLAMTRIITRKFMTTYKGESAWSSHQTGAVQMLAFAGSMLAMGYMATVIKDILKGREPMNLANMSAKGWGRVVSQSGIGGVLEPMFALGTGDVRGSLAPLPTTLGSIAVEAFSGDAAGAVDKARPFYGSTYPLIGPAMAKLVGWSFGESLQELQRNREIFVANMFENQ